MKATNTPAQSAHKICGVSMAEISLAATKKIAAVRPSTDATTAKRSIEPSIPALPWPQAKPFAHPKIKYPAPLMKKFRMMTVRDEFTTARVVAQPTPSEPPKVDRPQ